MARRGSAAPLRTSCMTARRIVSRMADNPRRRLPRALALPVLLLALESSASADPLPPEPLDAAGIRLALEKLQVVGGALFIAAHPDDENTAFLTWLSKGRKVRAGYLSV